MADKGDAQTTSTHLKIVERHYWVGRFTKTSLDSLVNGRGIFSSRNM
jgi:hypothetical protein